MVTLEEYELYLSAREGDFRGLIERLRKGAELSPEVRNLLADILEGNLEPPRHRLRRKSTDERHLSIAARVRELEREGWKQAAAILQVEAEFKCSDRTVRTAIKKLRLRETAEAEAHAWMEALFRKILNETLTPDEVERVMRYAAEPGRLLAKKSAT